MELKYGALYSHLHLLDIIIMHIWHAWYSRMYIYKQGIVNTVTAHKKYNIHNTCYIHVTNA